MVAEEVVETSSPVFFFVRTNSSPARFPYNTERTKSLVFLTPPSLGH